MRGRFITFEGTEGVGKSTQMAGAAAHLQSRGLEVVLTRQPGGTPLAEELRQLVLHRDSERVNVATELLMLFAARATCVENVIRPALARGAWVLCDRFTDATLAYQGGGRGVPRELILVLAEVAHPGLWPDLTLFLDAPVALTATRMAARATGRDRIEAEEPTFFLRVQQSYEALAAQEPARIKRIDASGTVDEVGGQVRACLDALLAGVES